MNARLEGLTTATSAVAQYRSNKEKRSSMVRCVVCGIARHPTAAHGAAVAPGRRESRQVSRVS